VDDKGKRRRQFPQGVKPLRASFYQRRREFRGWKTVPQRLKPAMAVSFTARLNPCRSRTQFSRRLFSPTYLHRVFGSLQRSRPCASLLLLAAARNPPILLWALHCIAYLRGSGTIEFPYRRSAVDAGDCEHSHWRINRAQNLAGHRVLHGANNSRHG
jgi:hypothetical protein